MTLGRSKKAMAGLLLPLLAVCAGAQTEPQPPPAGDSSTQLLSPQQLDNLVAPVALYPDPLLAQVFAAATYPLELVEMQQWMQDHRDLRGQQLMDAAKQQNWDPSIQAMVAFPDAIAMLSRDVRWTTDLGNAFLAQQADVMAAVQRMRARAQSNGRLQSTQQQTVTTQTEDGGSAIDIEPADPQVVYVPTYNPAYVWGPPLYGYYPPLWYPSYGFGWGAPCYLGGFFAGFGGFGLGWGWGFGWFGHSLFVNGGFFNHYGFHDGFGRGFGGREAWAHNSFHRLGVPYANRGVANRFGGNARFNGAARTGPSGGWRSFGGAGNARSFNNERGNSFAGSNRAGAAGNSRGFSENNRGASMNNGANRGWNNGGNRGETGGWNRGGASNFQGQSRSFAPANRAPAQNFSGQRNSGQSFERGGSAPHYSAPRSSGGSFGGGGGGHFSAPRSSGGSFGGGHASAPHSSGGGGHSGGGGGGHHR